MLKPNNCGWLLQLFRGRNDLQKKKAALHSVLELFCVVYHLPISTLYEYFLEIRTKL